MTQQNRIVITVVGALVAAAAFYFLILSPKRDEVTTLTASISTAQGELNAARDLLATNQKAQGGYKRAYASVVRLGKAVPADDDVRSLMVQIDSAAKRSNVDFRTINVGGAVAAPAAATSAASTTQLPPGATVGEAGFPVMPFSFSFDGSFFRLSDFLSRLERFVRVSNEKVQVTGRLLTLDSLSLEPAGDGFPNITAQVGATSYLVSPLEGLTAGATAQGPAAAPGGAAKPAPSGSAPVAPVTAATSTGALR